VLVSGTLKVSSPQRHTLELRHWGEDDRVLRIRFDPRLCDGQLVTELEPPVDIASCRSDIAVALSKAPPSQRRRKFVLSASSGSSGATTLEQQQQQQQEEEVDEQQQECYVRGLCPSALSVERVLLLGGLAHAEARLDQLGLALDAAILEHELGGSSCPPCSSAASSSGNAARAVDTSAQPQWGPRFRYEVAMVTEGQQVALQVRLPAARYLRVAVEMRTGDLIVTLVRKRQQKQEKEEREEEGGMHVGLEEETGGEKMSKPNPINSTWYSAPRYTSV